MRAALVLEQQALLLSRLTTPQYSSYMTTFQKDVYRKNSGLTINDPHTGKPSGWHFCNREVKRLEMAEAYFVAKDMVQVALWAAAGLDESDTFRHDLWPTDYGFMWLEDALVSKEMWGRTITTKAISWGRSVANGKPGTMVVFYTDMLDERDEVNTGIRLEAIAANDWEKYERMGNLHVHHIQWISDGHDVGPSILPVPDRYQEFARDDYQLAAEAPNDFRFVLAILMLLNQTVARVATEEADKRTAKRMRRMNLPPQITVVELRRHEGSRSEGESLVEWAHRWIVRGHWAWRACGPDHPFAQPYEKGFRARVYIAPFVKGPENMPLRQSTKVYSLVR